MRGAVVCGLRVIGLNGLVGKYGCTVALQAVSSCEHYGGGVCRRLGYPFATKAGDVARLGVSAPFKCNGVALIGFDRMCFHRVRWLCFRSFLGCVPACFPLRRGRAALRGCILSKIRLPALPAFPRFVGVVMSSGARAENVGDYGNRIVGASHALGAFGKGQCRRSSVDRVCACKCCEVSTGALVGVG